MANPLNNTPQPFEQAIGNVGEMPQVGLQSGASPAFLTPEGNSSAQKFAQLAKAFGGFEQGFDKLAEHGREQTIQNEQERAVMDTIHRDGAKPVLNGEESAWYADTSMKLYGQRAATDAITDLNSQIEALKEDPEKLRSLDPRAFLDDWAKKNITGIDDPIVAKEVYGAVQSAIPSHIANLGNAKRAQLKADLKAQAQAKEDAGYALAHSMFPTLSEFTPEGMWSKFGQMTAQGYTEKQAASMLVQAYQDTVNSRGAISSPDELMAAAAAMESKNPSKTRGGANFSLYEYLGSDKSSTDTLSNTSKFARSQSEQIHEKQLAKAIEAQNFQAQEYTNNLMNRVQYQAYTPTPQELAQLPESGNNLRGQVLGALKERMTNDVMHQQADGVITSVGADNSGMEQGEKQAAFDRKIGDIIGKTPYDPQNREPWTASVASILDLRRNNNRSMSLALIKNQVANGWMDPAPEKGAPISNRTLKGLDVYNLMSTHPEKYNGMIDELFAPKDQAYYKSIQAHMTVGGMDLPSAMRMAQTEVSDTNVEGAHRFLDVEGNRKKAADIAISELQSTWGNYVYDNYTRDTEAAIRVDFDRYAETHALTVRNNSALGKGYAEYFQRNTVNVEDPDSGMLGVGKRDRKFPLPRDGNNAIGFGSRGADKTPLEPKEYGRSIELYEKEYNRVMNGPATAGSNHAPGKYRLFPDFRNPSVLHVYKNDAPTAQVIPSSEVWDTYAEHVGKNPLLGKKEYVTRDKAAAKVQAQIDGMYQSTSQTLATSGAAPDPAFMPAPQKSKTKNVAGAFGLDIPALPPSFPVPPGLKGIPGTSRMDSLPPIPVPTGKPPTPPTASLSKGKKDLFGLPPLPSRG